jgi:hypothetical protein
VSHTDITAIYSFACPCGRIIFNSCAYSFSQSNNFPPFVWSEASPQRSQERATRPTLGHEKPVQHTSLGWSHLYYSTSRIWPFSFSIIRYKRVYSTCSADTSNVWNIHNTIMLVDANYGTVGFWRARSGNIHFRFKPQLDNSVWVRGGGRFKKYVFSIPDM